VTGRLPALGDVATLGRTREAWHTVAEHVLAAARYAVEARIGLAAAPGGFGIPPESACRPARVEGRQLVVGTPDDARTEPLTTVAAAAAALGIEAGAPPVYPPVTPLAPDAPLDVDDAAAQVLAAWFGLSWSVLTELGASVTLWPEHFDAATVVGDEERGQRGTYGASPGDAEHPEPYLYVTPWAEVRADAYWNDETFHGASLGYRDVAAAPDAVAAVTAFYAKGRALLTRE
jgi:hypothetical protein